MYAVMKRGEMVIEVIFRGFLDRLAVAGGTAFRVGPDMVRFDSGGWHPRNDLGFTISTQTRALLEHVIRPRLLENGNVVIRERCRFRGLMMDQADGRVQGVKIRGNGLETLATDLVIDAMGRSSPMPRYLEGGAGGEAPVQVTEIDINYPTILLNEPEQWRGDPWSYIMLTTAPDQTHGATITPIEGNRCLLTMVSRFGDQFPTELADCFAFTKALIHRKSSSASVTRNWRPRPSAFKFQSPGSRTLTGCRVFRWDCCHWAM